MIDDYACSIEKALGAVLGASAKKKKITVPEDPTLRNYVRKSHTFLATGMRPR